MCFSTHGSDDYLDGEEGLNDGDHHTSLSDRAPFELVLREIETKSPSTICMSVLVNTDKGRINAIFFVDATINLRQKKERESADGARVGPRG